jgi:hypothetical protein
MKSYKEPTEMPDRKDFTDNWVRTFEIIDEYLMRLIGDKCMVPLFYVVRKDAEVVPEANDPPTNYVSRWSEMCARMPHYTTTAGVRTPMPTYEEDNRKVWDKLATIFDTSDDYTYMKPFQRERDGRAAYKALYDHFLGPNNTDNMAVKADAEMAKLKYTGEKRRHNFETYVNAHKRLHNVYEDLKRHGHEGISMGTKVRRFIEGFETPMMNNCYHQILSTPALRRSFDDAVSYCTDYIKQAKHSQRSGDPGVQIGASGTATPTAGHAASSRNRAGKRKNNINWDTSNVNVELRHYTSEEYKKLTDPQKLKLKRLRAGGHTNQELSSTMLNPDDPLMKKVIAAMQSGKPPANKKGPQKGKPKGALKNRNNKALVKQVTTKDSDDSEA